MYRSFMVKIHPSDKRRAFQDLERIGGEILDEDDMFAPPPSGYNRISEGMTERDIYQWLDQPYILEWWVKLDDVDDEDMEEGE